MALPIISQIPRKFQLALDIDLSECRFLLPRVDILIYEQMNSQNFKRIGAGHCKTLIFDLDVCLFICDVCQTKISHSNPIYTHPEWIGTSVCTRCITKAFQNKVISYQSPYHKGPIYRMSDIVNAAEKKKETEAFETMFI